MLINQVIIIRTRCTQTEVFGDSSILIRTADMWSGRDIWPIPKHLYDLWNMRINKLMHVNISSLKLQATSRALTAACNARLRPAMLRLSVIHCYAAIFYSLRDIYDLWVSLARSHERTHHFDSLWLDSIPELFVDALIFREREPEQEFWISAIKLPLISYFLSYSLKERT